MKLYHAQNNEVAHYSDHPEDRFIWANGSLEARDKLKKILDEEEMEWNIDEFEIYEVVSEDGDVVSDKSDYWQALNEEEKADLEHIADSYGVEREKLWNLYKEIMKRNLYQDLCEIAKENEEYLKGE